MNSIFFRIFQVAENVIATVDGVLDTDEEILIESIEQMSTSSNILSQLDTLALNQPTTENVKLSSIEISGLVSWNRIP